MTLTIFCRQCGNEYPLRMEHCPNCMTEKSILEEAEQIINGPRRDSYGPVEDSFQRIAQVWSATLQHPVTAHQVALCMIGLKLCREANGHQRDNLVDIAGYTALAGKVAK